MPSATLTSSARWFRDYLPPGGEPHSLKSALALHHGIRDDEGISIKISDDALEKSTSEVIGPEDPKILRVYRPGGQSDEGDIVLTMTSWEYPSIAGKGSRMASGILYSELGVFKSEPCLCQPIEQGMGEELGDVSDTRRPRSADSLRV